MKLQVHTLRYGSPEWLNLFAPSLEQWCEKHGYELVLWDDTHGYSCPKFVEKDMVDFFLHSGAAQMLYVDADVFVHPDAPKFPSLQGLCATTDIWHQVHNEHFQQWVKDQYGSKVPEDRLEKWQYVNAGVWSLDAAAAQKLAAAMDKLPPVEFFQDQHWFNACAVLTGVQPLSATWNRYGRDLEPAWFYHMWGSTKEVDLENLKRLGLLTKRSPTSSNSTGLIHNVHHTPYESDKTLVLEFIQDAGLGNQMFEWAAGYAISKSLGIPFLWTWKPSRLREFELTEFGIGESPRVDYQKVMQKAGQGSRRLYELAKLKVDMSNHPYPAVSCPFQDEKCFIDVADEIAERYMPEPMELPIPAGKIPVGVQVRRGDYLKHSRLNVTTPDYFANAMRWMREKVPDCHFVVISDDPVWCTQVFGYLPDVTVMPPQDSYTGIRTLASCHGHIISNSTFGWWGAWLGERRNGGPVIVPERWHNGGNSYGDWNPVPDRWNRVSIGRRVAATIIDPLPPVVVPGLPDHARAIVYPWHADLEKWHELRYSLRSVDKFFEDEDCPIYILGTRKPGWLIETGRVKYMGAYTYREALTKGVQLAEKVLWMNDDIVMLRDTSWADCEQTLYLKDVSLEWVERCETQTNPWREGCVRILRALASEGIKEQRVYSTHTPYVYHREKALEVMKKYGLWEKFPMELAYFHHHAVDPTKITTERVTGLPFGEARFLNYSDQTLGMELKKAISRLLPERPAWEMNVGFGA